MTTREEPPVEDDDIGCVIAILRTARRLTQTELAKDSGVGQSSISEYELDKKEPQFSTLDRLLSSMGYHLSAVEETRAFLTTLRRRHTFAAPEDRGEAQGLLKRLSSHAPEVQFPLVREAREFQNWALSELLALESGKALAADVAHAVHLAKLAVAVAEAIPGDNPFLRKVRWFAWAHLANALRVLGELRKADEAFATSDRFWKSGQGRADTLLLDEPRVVAMKASLRREQRLLREALELFDRALELDKGPLRATFLVSKAMVLEELDDLHGAITLLQEADTACDPADQRLLFVIRHNLLDFLAKAGHYQEAHQLLPEVGELARRFGDTLDLVRHRWTEGRILGGLGQVDLAIQRLTQVRAEFAQRGMHYDTALISLELAALYARDNRVADVKTLARHLVPIFQANGVHREALAALSFFRQAAEKEQASLDVVQRVQAFMAKVRRNPELKWSHT